MSMSASERGPTIDSKEACSVGESATNTWCSLVGVPPAEKSGRQIEAG
jgi:hypothetical protein